MWLYIYDMAEDIPNSGELNPYRQVPDIMRATLADPTVNQAEHDLYFPRLQTLLPSPGFRLSPHRIRRVLDFGCGPGNFTKDIAGLYPSATVLGVDTEEAMLPASDKSTQNVSFRQWDSVEPLGEAPFNLIAAKLVLHYLSPDELAKVMPNLTSLLAPQASFVVSIPHSADSGRFVNTEHGVSQSPAMIRREVGQTGVIGTMWHRDHWLASTLRLIPPEYVAIRDEVKNSSGEPKRLNFLFCPRGDRVVAAFGKLRRLGLTSESPKISAELTEELCDEIRAAADYYAGQGEL
jgi:SAM-dependent methyltransferase